MDLRRLTDRVCVAPQITAEDLPRLAAQGFRTVIDNRPDREVGAHEASAAMRAAAENAGLAFHYLPLDPAVGLTAELLEAMDAVLEAADPPVLAYCRSGTRSATLWALAERGRRPDAQIIALGAAAGYDLTAALR